MKERVAKSYSNDEVTRDVYLENMLNSQRYWLKYRNKQCLTESLFADAGTPANAAIYDECISKLNEVRVNELMRLPY